MNCSRGGCCTSHQISTRAVQLRSGSCLKVAAAFKPDDVSGRLEHPEAIFLLEIDLKHKSEFFCLIEHCPHLFLLSEASVLVGELNRIQHACFVSEGKANSRGG